MTSTELEALVGHLFVVGGRAISAASPGAVAMPPPKRTARGRDRDSFFALLSLSKGEHQPASFYEELTDKGASRYFKVSGSVTAALREAVGDINDAVYQINQQRDIPLSVGLTSAILREHELYIAISGPARCFLVRQGFAERFPDDEDIADGVISLGVDREPDVRYFRREIRAGDFLILSDSSFNRLNDETLLHALDTGEVNDALANLAAVAEDFSAAEVIKFVSPLVEGEADEFPEKKRTRVPPLPLFSGGKAEDVEDEDLTESAPLGHSLTTEQSSSAQPSSRSPVRTPTKPGDALQQAGHKTALGLARVTEGTKTLIERMLPEGDSDNPLTSRFQLSITMQIAVAFAVAVLIALATTAIYRFRGQTSQYAQLVREAQAEIETARASGNNQATARPHWENAVFLLDQATAIRSPGSEIQALRTEALQVLDSYDHVTRVTPILLREYEPAAHLRGPIVQGLNTYVIDTTNDILYREDLSEDGTTLVNRDPQIVTRQGELVNNQVVGGLVDLVWIEDGGVPQRNVLGIITRNGLLMTYSPSFDITAVAMPGYEAWGDPKAVALYENDLYLLDAGANEIWRYEASPDAYLNPPQRYFTDVEPNLSDAIDMTIDTNGNVYVLHSSGQMSKYFFGRPEPFEFTGLPQPISHPTSFFLNLTLYDRALFIADPGGKRLFATALNGAFLTNFKDTEDTIFEGLSGVYNQELPAFTYLTAGNRIYYFSRP